MSVRFQSFILRCIYIGGHCSIVAASTEEPRLPCVFGDDNGCSDRQCKCGVKLREITVVYLGPPIIKLFTAVLNPVVQ
jgi:hypothetical protein